MENDQGLTGRRLGAYLVQSRIGAGGMGEVYRARDTRLGRDVALKLLPPGLTSDPERLARLEREARALAALNHSNIAAIHGIEDSGDLRALVLELVEGDTLANRIARGPLGVRDALHLARQIADALDAAHEKGIVHRDLKPANIVITTSGTVKLLDFGLAKLEAGNSAVDVSRAPTITVDGTHAGVVMGTAAYMSPEQARGQPVDKRTDVWAFGCVLFEMLTGVRSFGRATMSDSLAAVLGEEPEWRRLPGSVDAGVQKLLRRCLEKDAARRLRDIAEARVAIDDALEQLRSTGGASLRPLRPGLVAAVALAAIVAVAGYSVWRANRQPAATPLALRFAQVTSAAGAEWFPSLTADGQWMTYSGDASGNRDIYLQSTTGQNAINLTPDSPESDDQPAFSPNGERIAFRSERGGGGIFLMGRTGEGVRRLTREGFRPTWSPDGRSIAYVTENIDIYPQNGRGGGGLVVVDVESGQARPLHESAVQASWSPDGRRIAVVLRDAAVQSNIATVSADGGDLVEAVSAAGWQWNPIWSADGRHLYFSSDHGGTMNLWRVAIDPASGRTAGEPAVVPAPTSYAVHPAVSSDGRRLAFSSVTISTNVAKLAFDPVTATARGAVAEVTSGSRAWANPHPSPDGEWVTFYSRLNPEGDVYVSRVDGTGLRSLTTDTALDRVPRWSPDGQWILFFSDRAGSLNLWGVHPDGSGLRQFTELYSTYPVWAPDAKRVAVSVRTPAGSGAPLVPDTVAIFDPSRLWKEQTPELLPKFGNDSERFIVNAWSPDGRFLVGQTSLMATGIVLYDLQSKQYERLSDAGEFPTWFPDSRRVLYADGTGRQFLVVDRVTKERRVAFTGDREVLGGPSLSRDGRWAYFSRRVTQADIWISPIE